MHRSHPKSLALDSRLIDALTDAAAFDYPVETVDLVETHISWVVLNNVFAYKIKKPLHLDFLDFSSLGKRRHFCEEEIRLNKPWAPDLYLDVVPVTVEDDQPKFGGQGVPIEFAVRMRRFDQALQLDHQLGAGKLTIDDMKELGQTIGARHENACVAAENLRSRYIAKTKAFIRDNFTALEGYVDTDRLSSLSRWTRQELDHIGDHLGRRFDNGRVRDCHGDLHLANLVRLPGGIACFDCIEFNTDLRIIDVVCDIAFLTMDLVSRERLDLASHFLNRYLACTGDYDGIAMLDLYFVYRCLVRAKVAVISNQKKSEDEAEGKAEDNPGLAEAYRYFEIAWRQANKARPILIVMHGVSGSGKTWLSGQLMAAFPAIRIRSDNERKRLHGLGETADSESNIAAGIYAEDVSERLYSRLLKYARVILRSGHNAILDATFLQAAQRSAAYAVADACECSVVLVHVDAPADVLRKRLKQRASAAKDASEAGLTVLDYQLETIEPISPQEQGKVIECDNSGDVDVTKLVERIRSL